MNHPVDELLTILFSREAQSELSRHVIEDLNKSWDYRENTELQSLALENMLNILSNKPYSDVEAVKIILRLLISSFQDDETIPILIRMLANRPYIYYPAILLGWFGSKAREAIPLLLIYASGSKITNIAQQALKRIGGVTKAQLYGTLKRLITELDGLGLLNLLLFTVDIYPDCITDQEFIQILQSSVDSSDSSLRGAILDFIDNLSWQNQNQYKYFIEKLTNDSNEIVKSTAFQMLQSL